MQKNNGQELAQIKKVLKEMIVKDLYLEDIRPEDIKDNEILFGEGLEIGRASCRERV